MEKKVDKVALLLRAAKVVALHSTRPGGVCKCGVWWSPMHVGEELEKAKLLSDLEDGERD